MRVSIFVMMSALASGIVSQPLARRSDGGYSPRAHGPGGPGGPGGAGFGPGPSGQGFDSDSDSDSDDPFAGIKDAKSIKNHVIKATTYMAPKMQATSKFWASNKVSNNVKITETRRSSNRNGRSLF